MDTQHQQHQQPSELDLHSESSTSSQNFNRLNNKRFFALFVLIILVFGSGFLIGRFKNNGLEKSKIDNNVTITPPINNTSVLNTDIPVFFRMYPSPNKKYFFYIYLAGSSEGENCGYGIINDTGQRYSVDGIKAKMLPCSQGQGNFSSPAFYTWIDDSRFVIEENTGEITIANVDKFQIEKYSYDSNKYYFVGVSKSMEYWLYTLKSSPENKVNYILMDKNNKVIKTFTFGSSDQNEFGLFRVFYDPVNEGFVFISRNYTGEYLTIKFEFLSMNDQAMRTILLTDPVQWQGRGCGGDNLLSKKIGEVIIDGSCLIVADKYRATDGNIHINL